MAAMIENAVEKAGGHPWLMLFLGILIGIGTAGVTILVALIGVAAALAGNGALPDVLSRLGY